MTGNSNDEEPGVPEGARATAAGTALRARIEAAIAFAGQSLSMPELAENGPVCRDVKRLCEQLNLALVALSQGRNSLGQPVSAREVGEELRQAIGDLVIYGTWLRLDADYSDEARDRLVTIRDQALGVVSALTGGGVVGESKPGTAPTVRREVPVQAPPPKAGNGLPETVPSLRSPPATPGVAPSPRPAGSVEERGPGADTLNLRRLGAELPKPASAAPIGISTVSGRRRPGNAEPPPPEAEQRRKEQRPAGKLRWGIPVGGVLAGVALCIGVALWLMGPPGEDGLVIEPLPPAYDSAGTVGQRRLVLLQHVVPQVQAQTHGEGMEETLARVREVYRSYNLGPWEPTSPRIAREEAMATAEQRTVQAMKGYPTFDARPAVAEAMRRFPVYEPGTVVTVNYQVNPGRILKVTGELKESTGSTVTIGNREIKLDDIIVEDPSHRDRFDRTKTMKHRQDLVRERQREYDMAKSETRSRYYVTFQEAELAANTAVNEERGYIFRGTEWYSPEELGRQLLQETGNQP